MGNEAENMPVLAQHQTAEGKVLLVCRGDICSEQTDAIVNAANERLQHHGGLASAISKAGGPQIQEESSNWVKRYGFCTTGKVAAATSSGNLPCGRIFHVTGPVWSQQIGNETEVVGRIKFWDGAYGSLVASAGNSEIEVAFVYSRLATGYIPMAGDEVRALVDLTQSKKSVFSARFVSGTPPHFDPPETDEALLEGAVNAALRKADEQGMESIAMPAIGTGMLGCPVDICARIQVKCALDVLRSAKHLALIRFTNSDRPTVRFFSSHQNHPTQINHSITSFPCR